MTSYERQKLKDLDNHHGKTHQIYFKRKTYKAHLTFDFDMFKLLFFDFKKWVLEKQVTAKKTDIDVKKAIEIYNYDQERLMQKKISANNMIYFIKLADFYGSYDNLKKQDLIPKATFYRNMANLKKIGLDKCQISEREFNTSYCYRANYKALAYLGLMS